MYLLETGNNLLLGYMPESLALLIFGASLIAFTIGLRKVFKQREYIKNQNTELSQTTIG